MERRAQRTDVQSSFRERVMARRRSRRGGEGEGEVGEVETQERKESEEERPCACGRKSSMPLPRRRSRLCRALLLEASRDCASSASPDLQMSNKPSVSLVGLVFAETGSWLLVHQPSRDVASHKMNLFAVLR
eukprot:2436561-Rhodomonas_salina.1